MFYVVYVKHCVNLGYVGKVELRTTFYVVHIYTVWRYTLRISNVHKNIIAGQINIKTITTLHRESFDTLSALWKEFKTFRNVSFPQRYSSQKVNILCAVYFNHNVTIFFIIFALGRLTRNSNNTYERVRVRNNNMLYISCTHNVFYTFAFHALKIRVNGVYSKRWVVIYVSYFLRSVSYEVCVLPKSGEFTEIPGKFREIPENPGNSRKFPRKSRGKIRGFFLFSGCNRL